MGHGCVWKSIQLVDLIGIDLVGVDFMGTHYLMHHLSLMLIYPREHHGPQLCLGEYPAVSDKVDGEVV